MQNIINTCTAVEWKLMQRTLLRKKAVHSMSMFLLFHIESSDVNHGKVYYARYMDFGCGVLGVSESQIHFWKRKVAFESGKDKLLLERVWTDEDVQFARCMFYTEHYNRNDVELIRSIFKEFGKCTANGEGIVLLGSTLHVQFTGNRVKVPSSEKWTNILSLQTGPHCGMDEVLKQRLRFCDASIPGLERRILVLKDLLYSNSAEFKFRVTNCNEVEDALNVLPNLGKHRDVVSKRGKRVLILEDMRTLPVKVGVCLHFKLEQRVALLLRTAEGLQLVQKAVGEDGLEAGRRMSKLHEVCNGNK